MSTFEKLLHELADVLQEAGIYGFLVLACLAVALVLYGAIRDELDDRRAAREDAFHPGSFGLRRGSRLREHFSRRHEVEIQTSGYSSSKWVHRE